MTTTHNRVALILDGGTTNSRLWATRPNGDVVAESKVAVGARDGARGALDLAAVVAQLIANVAARCSSLGFEPYVVVAGGMITSPTGLHEVPHVVGPAGLPELAAASRTVSLPHIYSLPFVFVPGIRFGSEAALEGNALVQALPQLDLVRGEELLCMGLLGQGVLSAPGVCFNLGSHWKRLQINAQGQLASSRSSVSGELVAAVASGTIISASLPQDWSLDLDPQWLQLGAQAAAARGLARAFYEVRLLDVAGTTTAAQRLAYVWGAAMGADAPSLFDGVSGTAVVVGRPALCAAFGVIAQERQVVLHTVTAEAAEHAFRLGCLRVLQTLDGV